MQREGDLGSRDVATTWLVAAVLRKAFADMMDDPLLSEDTAKMNLETRYMPPERISELLADAYEAPKDIIERTRKLLGIETK